MLAIYLWVDCPFLKHTSRHWRKSRRKRKLSIGRNWAQAFSDNKRKLRFGVGKIDDDLPIGRTQVLSTIFLSNRKIYLSHLDWNTMNCFLSCCKMIDSTSDTKMSTLLFQSIECHNNYFSNEGWRGFLLQKYECFCL